MVDAAYVIDEAKSVVIRFLDAQDSYDVIRVIKEVDRWAVVYAGNWFTGCEEAKEKFWANATGNFGVILDKGTIFDAARHYFVSRKPLVPTA